MASKIKSFVRRNGHLSPDQIATVSQYDHYLCEQLPPLPNKFVGLEIGFGMGDSLLDVIKKEPSQLWIGVEVYERGVSSVIKQALDQQLDNLLLRIGDVHDIIDNELTDNSLDHVRIFFPDPWPKKRHHKRRLVNTAFLNKLYSVLKADGIVHIATDNLSYAKACYDVVNEHNGFKIIDRAIERPMTKFAQKALDQQSVITDLVVQKQ